MDVQLYCLYDKLILVEILNTYKPNIINKNLEDLRFTSEEYITLEMFDVLVHKFDLVQKEIKL
jgi:hypothetical protein